ncbi:unnamed protein product [Penicillium pancosmium]
MTVLPSREELTSRVVPSMVFSDGSSSSMTPAPSSTIESDPAIGAEKRFSVRGNAIITGGAGTLGLQACNALLEHGLQGLMIFDINPANSEKEIAQLQNKFPETKIKYQKVDITDEEVVKNAVDETSRVLGSVDILVSFAGIVGAFICAQAAARHMVNQGSGGSITFIASISAHRVNYPQPQVAYNVSKSALLMLKSSLATEWARYGIRVNSVSPGYMDTILNEGDGIASHREVWSQRNPMGRMGSPSEVTGAVVFLSSASASYINGADIVVDGGAISL